MARESADEDERRERRRSRHASTDEAERRRSRRRSSAADHRRQSMNKSTERTKSGQSSPTKEERRSRRASFSGGPSREEPRSRRVSHSGSPTKEAYESRSRRVSRNGSPEKEDKERRRASHSGSPTKRASAIAASPTKRESGMHSREGSPRKESRSRRASYSGSPSKRHSGIAAGEPSSRKEHREKSSSPRKEHREKSTSPSKSKRDKSNSPRKSTAAAALAVDDHERSAATSSQTLSELSLAKLNAELDDTVAEKEPLRGGKPTKRKRKHPNLTPSFLEKRAARREQKKRAASGAVLEDQGQRRGRSKWLSKKMLLVYAVLIILLIIIVVPVGVVVGGKKKGGGSKIGSGSNAVSPDSIPSDAKGTYLDPFTWKDTKDFNLTFTRETVGGLYVMGLNSTWDDTTRPNANVPPLNQKFGYGQNPMRGVNIGGWLILEPFITPSIFSKYTAKQGIVDEWTLSQYLGPKDAADLLETHYSTWVNEQTFADIAAAGLDHVRIPYGYWAVRVYDGDQFVPQISWRYLLRAIEWARKHGLRVKLDLHSVPGGQNGWNHSGRQGIVQWLNGTDGDLWAQRSLDVHDQLSQFFAQPRYKNVVTLYGLVNEPRMTMFPEGKVQNWTVAAYNIVRKNGLNQYIIFGDGFLGLPKWQGEFTGLDGMLLDVHEYVIFNPSLIAMTHDIKLRYTCSGWTADIQKSMDKSTGFGPTFCGEWSQASTDCAPYLNNVGIGSRWMGSLNTGDPQTQMLSPGCAPAANGLCDCGPSNGDPSTYSADYKSFLIHFALAQMDSFEKGWGWFYWTWDTENLVQWSWKKGRAAGLLPQLAYQKDWNCSMPFPVFTNLSEAI